MSRSKNNILKESYTQWLYKSGFFPPEKQFQMLNLEISPSYSDCVWGDGSEEAELQTAIMLTDNDRRQIKH